MQNVLAGDGCDSLFGYTVIIQLFLAAKQLFWWP